MTQFIITETLLEAYLKCEYRFYLKAMDKAATDTKFSNYQRQISEDFRQEGSKHLLLHYDANKCFRGSPTITALKEKRYPLVIDCILSTEGIRSHIHAVERITCRGSRKSSVYVPVRFIPAERISKLDKLAVSFDAIVLSKYLGEEPLFAKIIHGGRFAHMKVRLPELMNIVNQYLEKMTLQHSGMKPPEIVLNKHCGQCEYSSLCHHIAAEKDDLSLLSNLTEKERRKLNNKGIFTVTQLSYTFRPRRKSKRMASKRPKYYHSLKALAIREQKTYLVGRPDLEIKGTPVYIDIENIPYRDFFYLIGLRFMNNDSYIQQHFWADEKQDERLIWYSFLDILPRIDSPVLVHYGSFETTFLRWMKARYGYGDPNHDFVERLIMGSVNVLSVIYGQVYFPTYSNGLKDVAKSLGFRWSDKDASGADCMLWRQQWEQTGDSSIKQKITTYNSEDCKALEIITHIIQQFRQFSMDNLESPDDKVVHTDCLTPENPFRLGRNKFATPALKDINRCAYWDYQRNKVYVKSSKRLKRICKKLKLIRTCKPPVNKVIECPAPENCPKCTAGKFTTLQRKTKIVYDIKFMNAGLKRWIVKYLFRRYACLKCGCSFLSNERGWTRSKYGHGLLCYIVYHIVDLCHTQGTIAKSIDQLFSLKITPGTISKLKKTASQYYERTYDILLQNILRGNFIQADETKVNVKGKYSYVWVIANLEEVVYLYSETREGDMIRELLNDFKGILISDFYTAYDSIDCPQQKCLVHFIRDLNDDIFKEPFNKELKQLAEDFGLMLRPVIMTVDRYGLKKHFLQKHQNAVNRFYKRLSNIEYRSETTIKYRNRLLKYRDKLFTFLHHDGIPWNNNNAEHAIKAFAVLRRIIGAFSEDGAREYLRLLSICQTCKKKGVSFLAFLRSGQKDINGFINTVGCGKR